MRKLIINTTNTLIKSGILSKALATQALTAVDFNANSVTVGADISGFLEAGRDIRIKPASLPTQTYTIRSVEVSGSDTIITMIQILDSNLAVADNLLFSDAINTSTKEITLDASVGDVAAEFTAGLPIGLIGLAVAGDVYTVASAVFDSGRTIVTVNENISSPEGHVLNGEGSSLSWTAAGGAGDALIMNQPSDHGGNYDFGGWEFAVRDGSLPHHQGGQVVVLTKGNTEFSELPTDIIVDGTPQTADAATVAAALDALLNP